MEVTSKNFNKEVIEKSKEIPVVVDFWAEWCRPCLFLGPILEKLSKEYDGKFILVKVNIEQSPLLARIYNIVSIPRVNMFKNGEVADEFVGAMPEPEVKKWLDKNLG